MESVLSRARFLRLAGATGVVAALPTGIAGAATAAIARRKIPASGEMLPVIGLGTARTFDVDGTADELAARRDVLRTLFGGGGGVVDSSPSYGNAEEISGRLIAELGARDRAFIATKISTWGGRDDGIAQMRDSMARYRTRRIDLMQVHNLKGTKTHLASIREWKEAGRIRYVGITHSRQEAHDDLERVMREEPLDFVQLNYSLSSRDAASRLLPLAAERGIAVLVNRPYDLGRLFRAVRGREVPAWANEFEAATWGQFFLKFVLADPAVTCVIPGTRKARHMADNLGAGRGRLPDPVQQRRMVGFLESL